MLAPLEYVESRRRRTIVLVAAAAVVAAVLVTLIVRRGAVPTVLVSAGRPYPASPAVPPPDWGSAQTLPGQDGPHGGELWVPWTLLAVDPDGQALTVAWTNIGADCAHGDAPVAVHVEQTDYALRIGLISPEGQAPCTAAGYSGKYRIQLAQPSREAIYRLGA